MPIMNLDDIPAPVGHVTIEHTKAFRQVLEHLFKIYPPDDGIAISALSVSPPGRKPAEFCRERAIKLMFGTRNNIRSAAYWACDTGVPNEEILSAYMLIFG